MVLDNLVETHCHILPGIDDGAPDVETSLKMIAKLQLQGAKTIILTPHYYSDSISLDDFLYMRERAFEELKSALPEDAPRLLLGAEVFISDYIFSNKSLDALKVANTDYILIEHPFSSSFSEKTYERLNNLYCDYGVKPILAHIERYQSLMDNPDLLDWYIDMGCLTQVNISSFSDSSRGTRKRLMKYLQSGRIHLLGSDCHNLTSRPPDYSAGVKELVKKCGTSALEQLITNANELVK